MGQVFAIFRNTLLESVRQPVYGLILVLACFLIGITPAMAAHIYTLNVGSGFELSPSRMIADLGLATMLMSGLLLAVFSSSGVIYREIEDKTALTVLSKRVRRSQFVLGKYLGVAAAIGLAAFVFTAQVLLTVRIGAKVSVGDPLDWGVIACMFLSVLLSIIIATFRTYYRGRPWVGSFTLSYISCMFFVFLFYMIFDKDYNVALLVSEAAKGESPMAGVTYDWEVARAAILTVEAILLMAGISIVASTRLAMGGNFAFCALVFLGGLTSEYFNGRYANSVLVNIWYRVVPDLQAFWMSDALTREKHIPTDYILSVTAYAVVYIAAMLCFAACLFQRREVS